MNKWDTHIAPYINEIESWAMRGAKEKEISEKLGISYATFRKYVNDKQELKTALVRGKNHAERVKAKALERQDASEWKPMPQSTRVQPTPGFAMKPNMKRPDQQGTHRGAFEKAKKRIYATQEVCGICGKPVDMSLKYPHPLSPCIDHIIPLAKGGHPSDISNLQLAHWTCNRQKSDKLINRSVISTVEVISNRVLPHSADWIHMTLPNC